MPKTRVYWEMQRGKLEASLLENDARACSIVFRTIALACCVANLATYILFWETCLAAWFFVQMGRVIQDCNHLFRQLYLVEQNMLSSPKTKEDLPARW
jgi:hypothetical protein